MDGYFFTDDLWEWFWNQDTLVIVIGCCLGYSFSCCVAFGVLDETIKMRDAYGVGKDPQILASIFWPITLIVLGGIWVGRQSVFLWKEHLKARDEDASSSEEERR